MAKTREGRRAELEALWSTEDGNAKSGRDTWPSQGNLWVSHIYRIYSVKSLLWNSSNPPKGRRWTFFSPGRGIPVTRLRLRFETGYRRFCRSASRGFRAKTLRRVSRGGMNCGAFLGKAKVSVIVVTPENMKSPVGLLRSGLDRGQAGRGTGLPLPCRCDSQDPLWHSALGLPMHGG